MILPKFSTPTPLSRPSFFCVGKGTAQNGILSLAQLPPRICLAKCLILWPVKSCAYLAHKHKVSGRMHRRESRGLAVFQKALSLSTEDSCKGQMMLSNDMRHDELWGSNQLKILRTNEQTGSTALMSLRCRTNIKVF